MNNHVSYLLGRFAATILLGAALVGFAAPAAFAGGEIIPSVGISRPVHDESSDVTMMGGLAIRGNLGPVFKTEIGGSYREDTQMDGALTTRMWPITASLWMVPIPALYAGGGVGWYHTSYDYADVLGFESHTEQQFGVHLGGGLMVPLAPRVGLDLNGRYVFLDKVETKLSTEKFDPDFWQTSLGLAFKF